MSWIYLIVAGLFEVAFTSCMGKVKETTGSEMYWWFTGFLVSMSISMFLLIKATQALPIGTAYAVWTGIGAVGTVLAGILIFKEPATVWRLLFILIDIPFCYIQFLRITSSPTPSPAYCLHHKVRCHRLPIYRKTLLHSMLSSHGLPLPYPDKPSLY